MEELSKEKLEIERLKIQIENERKPLYKKLSFYSALAPIAVSVVAIVFSVSTGFFENESKLLDLRKENLKFEINLFTHQKDSILTTLNILKEERDSIFKENSSLKTQYEKMKYLSDQINIRQAELNLQIKTLKDSIYSKQNNLSILSNKYSKLENDKTLLASKMKELEEAIQPQLSSDESTRIIFKDILKILDENLGGFNAGAMLLLFGN